MIYLDNAATTYPKPEEVYQAMDYAARNIGVNAGRGSYKTARNASAIISDTKDRMRSLIHVGKECPVIFSPSITVAINQIANGLEIARGVYVYVSPYEHNAVARCLEYLSKKNGFYIKMIPINKDNLKLDIDRTKYEFSKNKPYAVFCTHVSNVTGYVLPIHELFSVSKKYGAVNILDSAQSLGLIDFQGDKVRADIIAFAGHKTIYGPIGVGGFVNITGVKLSNFLVGGTGSNSLSLEMPNDDEGAFEPASHNIVAISGLNAALKVLKPKDNRRIEQELTAYLIENLRKIKRIKYFVNEEENEQTGIISFLVEGYNSSDIGLILDEDFDIAVRTGYHCAPYIHKYLGDMKNLGTVRIGIGRYNTKEDVDKLLEALRGIAHE